MQLIRILRSALIIIVITMNGIILYHYPRCAVAGEMHEELSPGPNVNKIPGGHIPGADPFHLLKENKNVREEIQLTQEQMKKIMEMERMFRSELRELSYQKDSADTQAEIARHLEAARNGMSRILTPVQIERLKQLLLQLQGPCAVILDDQLASKLQITALQINTINKICRSFDGRIHSGKANKTIEDEGIPLFPDKISPEDREEIQQSLRRANDKVISLFTDEQKETYFKAEGTPFSFKAPITITPTD